jgi:hypothetical protein
MNRRIVRKILVNLGIALTLWEITERVLPPFSWRPIAWAVLYVPTYVVVHMWLEAEPKTDCEESA